jgi:hypothetical protein
MSVDGERTDAFWAWETIYINSVLKDFLWNHGQLQSSPTSAVKYSYHIARSLPITTMKFRTIITVSIAGYVSATPVMFDAEPANLRPRTVGKCSFFIPHKISNKP